ncbi:MAG: OFA family MFS transporter [Deltaproteobacteria bacterium]|nr:OFA family MFS transporter [Deltaproteobacteria bacterium]
MKNRGWLIVLAGTVLNLALGVLYAWSIFSKQLTEPLEKGGFGWTRTAATLPYTLAIAVFAVMMIPAGRLQDRFGPRVVASAGALLCGVGLVVASFGGPESHLPVLIGFGLLSGSGFGLGYAATTPVAVKWFPPAKKGLITGIVVAGFGLAPVYIAPLSKYLLATYQVSGAFRILGVLFVLVAGAAAQFLVNPSEAAKASAPLPAGVPSLPPSQGSWREMLRAPTFWSLHLQYACGATAGLMIIGHIAKIVSTQSQNTIHTGFLFVALLAIFNASGRVVAGLVSDVIGRVAALTMVFVMQAAVMFFFNQFETVPGFVLGAAIVGFSYGSCLSLFPATVADLWGTKNMGLNYGILFTAWGVGGVVGPLLAGSIADSTGSYGLAYQVAGALLLFAALLAMVSHIHLSINIPEKQVVISFGKRRAGVAPPPLAAKDQKVA